MKYKVFFLSLCLLSGCGSGPDNSLHHAAAQGDSALIARLLAQGADVNGQDEQGNTPIHYAADQNRTEAISLLVEAGADLNARQKRGTTALHHVIAVDNPDMVRFLLEQGADPNIRANNGLTALDEAKMMKRTAIVKVLKDHGAREAGFQLDAVKDKPQVKQKGKARYKLTVYTPGGQEVPRFSRYGTQVIQSQFGQAILVTLDKSQVSLALQDFPPGAYADIVDLRTGEVVFRQKY